MERDDRKWLLNILLKKIHSFKYDFSREFCCTSFTRRKLISIVWFLQAPGGLEDERGKGLNRGKLYISKSSPNCVLKAYSQQFQNDFSHFLESRSQEMVHGGRMVLSFMGRESMDPTSPNCCYQWELLAQALMTLVLEVLQLFSTYIRVTSLLPYTLLQNP